MSSGHGRPTPRFVGRSGVGSRPARPVLLSLLALVFLACTGESLPETSTLVRTGQAGEISPPPTPPGNQNGRLGVLTYPSSRGWSRVLGAPDQTGAVVVAALPGGAAARAGVRRGDVVTQVDRDPVSNDERFVARVRGPIGRRVRLEIARGGSHLNLTITLASPSPVTPVAHYDALIAAEPKDAVAFLLRAQTREETGVALLDVNRALGILPDFPEALAYRARLLWRRALTDTGASAQTDMQRAVADYAQALRLDPRSIKILVARGNSLLEAGLRDAAERDAVTAVAIDATYASAHDLLARARSAGGAAALALSSAREAVDLAPYDPRFYRTLALAFLAAGRRSDAEATVRAGLAVAADAQDRALLEEVLASPSASPSRG